MSNTSQEQQLQARIKELESEILSLKKRKKYGLVWEDKKEDVVAQCETHVPVLSEVKGKKISDKNQPSENIIIEGDNYHALSVLSYTHRNAIDVIYIDPPYNTGNSSWRYNNDYVDGDDSFKHSKWLSMMEKRIRLGRQLLKDDGVLFITIDDYEIFTLGLLADSIFGETNRMGVVAIEINPRGRTNNKNFATSHEYILMYGKSELAQVFDFELNEDQIANFSYKDEISSYRLLPFRRSGGLSTPKDRPNSEFPILYSTKNKKIIGVGGPRNNSYKDNYSTDTVFIYLNKKIKEIPYKEYQKKHAKDVVEIYPIDTSKKRRVWRWSDRKKILTSAIEGDFVIKPNKTSYQVLLKDRIKSGRKPKTMWSHPKYDASSHGTNLLKEIFEGDKLFNYPKSLHAVIDTLKVSLAKEKDDALILDFFAGSGTTGHAVLELNKEDGGNRQFILCTNNENKIAEEVTYPRVKKVIQGYGDTDGLGGALRYYKTKLVDIEKLQKIPDERRLKLTYQAGEMIALRENTLDETEKNEWWQIFENNNKTVAIYFQEDKQKLRDLVKKIDSNEQVVLYVFSWGKNEYKNEFAEYQNIRVEDIPEPIIEVYKEINRLK